MSKWGLHRALTARCKKSNRTTVSTDDIQGETGGGVTKERASSLPQSTVKELLRKTSMGKEVRSVTPPLVGSQEHLDTIEGIVLSKKSRSGCVLKVAPEHQCSSKPKQKSNGLTYPGGRLGMMQAVLFLRETLIKLRNNHVE